MKITGRIVDLSVPVQHGTGNAPPAKRDTSLETYSRPGKTHWQGSWISATTHVGTHVDSPLHVVKDARPIGLTPLERTMGEAVVLDLRPIQPNQAMGPEILEPHRSKIQEGDIIVLRTDWSDKTWGKMEFWTESPFLTVEAAEWLAARKPKALAFDFFEEYIARFVEFSADEFVVHHVLLRDHDIPLIENITNLGALTRERVTLFAAPVKLVTAEGAFARVFAIEA